MEITETMKYNVKYDVFVDIDGSIYWRDIYGNINPKKQHINRKGYAFIILGRRARKYNVHRIVAETFIPNPDNKPEVDHINRIRNDNRVENLRWVTRHENLQNRSSTRKHRKHVYTEPHSEFGRLFLEKYGILRGEDPLLYNRERAYYQYHGHLRQ